MHPLQNGSQVSVRPANKPTTGDPGYFTESGDNNVPSYPGQDWFNDSIDEFLNFLYQGGVQYNPQSVSNLAEVLVKLQSRLSILESPSNLVLNNISEIPPITRTGISSISIPSSGEFYSVESSAYGLVDSPDIIEMDSGRFAKRIKGYKPKRIGVFNTGDFGHRAGSFTYEKLSAYKAKLRSSFEHFKPNLAAEFVPTVKYIDPINGDIANDGDSWATAYSRWAECIASNPDIIYIRGGFLTGSNRITQFTTTKDLAIIAVDGPVITGPLQTGTWSKLSGFNYVYELIPDISASETTAVFDRIERDQYGAPNVLTKVATIADVESTPNSWTVDIANNRVYVRTNNDRTLDGIDESIVMAIQGSGMKITYSGDHKIYAYGIEFWCGLQNSSSGNTNVLALISDGSQHPGSVFYGENCSYNGSMNSIFGNGLAGRDIGLVISDKCESSVNVRDGFNYHDGNNGDGGNTSLSCHFIEIDCFASGNGVGRNDGNNQGSTSHNACIGFRINTVSTGNRDGGCIVDVDASKVWNVAITCKHSPIVGALLYSDGSYNGDYGEWWVDGAIIQNQSTAAGQRSGDLSLSGSYAKLHMQDVLSDKPLAADVDVISVDTVF